MSDGLTTAPQWQPGQSGNPKGKPKGTRNFTTIIREMVENPKYKVRLKDGTVVKNPGVLVAHSMLTKALEGDVAAATWLTKYGYGDKLVSEIDVTSNGESVGVSTQLSGDFAKYLLEKTRVSPVIEGVVTSTTDTDISPGPLEK